MKRPAWPRLGLRREMQILLPVSLLVMVLLSSFTLFSYRSALGLLVTERQREAVAVARGAAEAIAGGTLSTPDGLLRTAPPALRLALVDERGGIDVLLGSFPSDDLLAPLAGSEAGAGRAIGPDELVPDAVAGFAALRRGGRRLVLRVDLPAAELARQLRTLRVLTWVVVAVNLLFTVLVLVYLRHLLAPWEGLLERAAAVATSADEEHEISGLVATFERALTALERSGQASGDDDISTLQRTLAPSLESGLLLLDRQGRVLALNPVGASLVGLPVPAPGLTLEEAIGSRPHLYATLSQALETGVGVRRAEVPIEVDGERRTLGLTAHALRRDDGEVRGYLALFVDLTSARRQADEERLSESLTQLGELAAGIAHELRNSLATLRGYLTLIERRPDEESIRDYLQEIRHETDHLVRVIEDFLEFARPESARAERVDLVEVAGRAAADPTLQGQPIEVTTDGLDTPHLHGDSQLLLRALRNLLHNAAEAQRQVAVSTPLEIRLATVGDGVEIAILDHGPGLPDAVRERLFQPFVTGRPDGVGLGLSLAHRIVALHRGSLHLEARAGGGTRAVLRFPSDTIVT